MEDLKRELTAAQIATSKMERVGKRLHLQLRDPSKSAGFSDLLKNLRLSRAIPFLDSKIARNDASVSLRSTSLSRPSGTVSISSASASPSFSAAEPTGSSSNCRGSRIRNGRRISSARQPSWSSNW
jgi:hypothetical protein